MKKLFEKKATVKKEAMETLILESTLIKLGGLLAVGFGQAGADMIGQNMGSGRSAVNAMVAGKVLFYKVQKFLTKNAMPGGR